MKAHRIAKYVLCFVLFGVALVSALDAQTPAPYPHSVNSTRTVSYSYGANTYTVEVQVVYNGAGSGSVTATYVSHTGSTPASNMALTVHRVRYYDGASTFSSTTFSDPYGSATVNFTDPTTAHFTMPTVEFPNGGWVRIAWPGKGAWTNQSSTHNIGEWVSLPPPDPCGPMSGSRIVNNTGWQAQKYALVSESGERKMEWIVQPQSSRSLVWDLAEACEPHYIVLLGVIDGQEVPVGEPVGDPILPDSEEDHEPDPPENPVLDDDGTEPLPVPNPIDEENDSVQTTISKLYNMIWGEGVNPGELPKPEDAESPSQDDIEEQGPNPGVFGDKLDSLIPEMPTVIMPSGSVSAFAIEVEMPGFLGGEVMDLGFDLAVYDAYIAPLRAMFLGLLYFLAYFIFIKILREAFAG